MSDRPSAAATVPTAIIAVLPGAAALSGRLARAADGAGWRIEVVAGPGDTERPDLVIGTAAELTERSATLDIATGRIALGDEPGDAGDESLDEDAAASAIAALLARWSPSPLPPAAQRQRDAFGREAIDRLLVSLRERLSTVLTMNREAARAGAHQLAGLTGMLGFAELSEAWEGYSTGGDSRRSEARRLARLALATLRRSELCDGGH